MSETPPEAIVACSRCHLPDVPALKKPPLHGPIGKELQARVCAYCWEEWQKAEVMVINELRLNFMDPAAQTVLNRQMREFFLLDPPGSPTAPPADPAP